ncbi:MAG: GNAT family N-acetyltransferase [Pyrinomonadaceae bacterium]|nr:GNAT family N-acetyltransferase [Pyrinomonadaceae bacterium]
MLETERLFLRKLQDHDIEEIFDMRSDPSVMKYIREPQTKKEESLNWIKMISKYWVPDGIGFCAIIEKESKSFLGWCGLWRIPETDEIEVGYAIKKDQWGKGFATEAAERFLKYGFEDLGLEKVVAVAFPQNKASRSVMRKLGMEYAGIGNYYNKSLVKYEIARSEFESSILDQHPDS